MNRVGSSTGRIFSALSGARIRSRRIRAPRRPSPSRSQVNVEIAGVACRLRSVSPTQTSEMSLGIAQPVARERLQHAGEHLRSERDDRCRTVLALQQLADVAEGDARALRLRPDQIAIDLESGLIC